MKTRDIYNIMERRNLTPSMRHWSQEWLGHAQNYCASHGSEPLPAETAIRLRRRLVEAGHHDLAAMILISLLGDLDSSRRVARRTRQT